MDTTKKVLAIISEQLSTKAEDIKLEHHLINDLKADSLDIVEITMSVEEAFNLQISDDEAETLSNVQELIDFLNKKIQ
ncbi:MAG: acyl carrier protein [Bdellovibrionales bacterium]